IVVYGLNVNLYLYSAAKMLSGISLVLLLSLSTLDARVTFEHAQVMDSVDLRGTNKARLGCISGCKVYSPTRNEKIVIVDNLGMEPDLNLLMIAEMPFGDSLILPPSQLGYSLQNKGVPDPSFVLYTVEEESENYFTPVAYVDASSNVTLVNGGGFRMITVMSQSGSIHFSDFKGDFVDALPSVYATGFDSIATASPVYTARSASLALASAFSVYSPIATISYKRNSDKSVIVSGVATQSSMGQDSSAVYVSPGYVGFGDSLYSLVPSITSIGPMVVVSRAEGLSVAVNGNYAISYQSDSLDLMVNMDIMTLTGKNSISKTYSDTEFAIALAWWKKEGSEDGFAIQVDIATDPRLLPDHVTTTTTAKADTSSSTVPIAPTTPGNADVTTSVGVNQQLSLTTFAVISMFRLL
ncbi:hypothetical protein PMAYCL1PPCAC_00923, partial [Pristionchus mayeri]